MEKRQEYVLIGCGHLGKRDVKKDKNIYINLFTSITWNVGAMFLFLLELLSISRLGTKLVLI